jgi:hypothetical protein
MCYLKCIVCDIDTPIEYPSGRGRECKYLYGKCDACKNEPIPRDDSRAIIYTIKITIQDEEHKFRITGKEEKEILDNLHLSTSFRDLFDYDSPLTFNRGDRNYPIHECLFDCEMWGIPKSSCEHDSQTIIDLTEEQWKELVHRMVATKKIKLKRVPDEVMFVSSYI